MKPLKRFLCNYIPFPRLKSWAVVEKFLLRKVVD